MGMERTDTNALDEIAQLENWVSNECVVERLNDGADLTITCYQHA
jgi:hypothetical protein